MENGVYFSGIRHFLIGLHETDDSINWEELLVEDFKFVLFLWEAGEQKLVVVGVVEEYLAKELTLHFCGNNLARLSESRHLIAKLSAPLNFLFDDLFNM
jgi:hypothetical protein